MHARCILLVSLFRTVSVLLLANFYSVNTFNHRCHCHRSPWLLTFNFLWRQSVRSVSFQWAAQPLFLTKMQFCIVSWGKIIWAQMLVCKVLMAREIKVLFIVRILDIEGSTSAFTAWSSWSIIMAQEKYGSSKNTAGDILILHFRTPNANSAYTNCDCISVSNLLCVNSEVSLQRLE